MLMILFLVAAISVPTAGAVAEAMTAATVAQQ